MQKEKPKGKKAVNFNIVKKETYITNYKKISYLSDMS